MKLNVDLSKRAVEYSAAKNWSATTADGVERRMLERDGREIARATTIVRFAPGAKFDHHKHGAGEEIFVIDGVFSDEFGDYPAGSYLRNPPGSAHAPFSRDGCTLFVKLRQMTDESERVVICPDQSPWRRTTTQGLSVRTLLDRPDEQVALFRFDSGAALPSHRHPLGIELFVLEGELADEFGHYPAGTWIRNPGGSYVSPSSRTGATVYVKTGHLPVLRASAA